MGSISKKIAMMASVPITM